MSLQRYLATILVSFLLALSGLAVYSIPTQAVPQNQQPAAAATKLYLPVVSMGDRPFSGKITFNGSPVNGVKVTMYSYVYGNLTTYATATTGSDGSYLFPTTPNFLAGNQNLSFYVYYANDRSGALSYFQCYSVINYSQPFNCSFDIGDVTPSNPNPTSHVQLPYNFSWQPRAISTDSYIWTLYTKNSDGSYSQVNSFAYEVGYNGSYRVTSLPGISTGTTYYWSVNVRQPSGFGRSNTDFEVHFNNTGQ